MRNRPIALFELTLVCTLGCTQAESQRSTGSRDSVEVRLAASTSPLVAVTEQKRPIFPPAPTSQKVEGLTPDYLPLEGDVLFQSLPINPLVLAIEGATESPYSHCGIVCQADGQWKVLEAIGPVVETPIHAWINQSRDGRVFLYRFRAEYRDKIPVLLTAGREFAGRPYDIHYDFDDEKIYCSELIYKAFRNVTNDDLGQLQKLGDLKWEAYAAVIQSIEDGNVPVERLMITPRSLSEAKQLEWIGEYGPDTKSENEDPSP